VVFWLEASVGHVGDVDQAASLIKLADDLRELLSCLAGQNDKASGCYGAHHRRSPGSVTKHMNVPKAALVRSTVIAIQRETTCSRLSGRDALVK
jgi:hypothetical protein